MIFAARFTVRTLFSIIGVRIEQALGLNETQFGLLLGMPIPTGGAELALYLLTMFYLICNALTWWYYARPRAEVPC